MLTRITGIYRKIVDITDDLGEPIDYGIWIVSASIQDDEESAYTHLVKKAGDAQFM